ncbi:MAG: calcium-binding protein [Pseudomonadota bacterium]
MRAASFMQLFAAIWVAVFPGSLTAHEQAERVYVFGNSLVHHLTDSEDTTLPHWLGLISKAAGEDFALSGQWGFLRDFRRALPPEPNWSFREAKPAWNSDRRAFGDAGLTSVWITPANFIQGNAIDAPFDGDNPDNLNPLGVTQDVLGWAVGEAPDAQLFVYEGWPEMGAITRGFPPDERGLEAYHAYALGDYAKWFDSYVAALSERQPVRLIPVSRVLSSVMTDTALASVPVDTFYSDDAPHGTSATYLMAAMVAYNTLHGTPIPDSFRPPSTVAPALRATFPMVRDAIWERVATYLAEENLRIEAAVEAPVAAAETEETAAAPATSGQSDSMAQPANMHMAQDQLLNPSLAMGLNGIADWSVQHPFLDLMKTARPWVGHTNDQWGAYDAEAIASGGYLNAQGWPVKLPDDARALEAFILTDQPAEATDLAGRYIVTFEGQGDLTIGGLAKNVRNTGTEISFDYTPGEGLVSIEVSKTDAADPIRNIRIFREDTRVLVEAGVTFNPAWLARIENLRSLRFMDWMATNGSTLSTWDERPTRETYSYVSKGVPAEVMIELSNLVGADPWFTMPHMADDGYFQQFAELARDTLRPDLRAYVEYSNEVWNFIFPQAVYARDQAQARWGDEAGDDAWMQFYGMRAAQMAQIWAEVYGRDASTRLVSVIGTHTGWLGLEEASLNAPLWVAEDAGNWEPYVYFNAYAVTGYFGYEMGTEDGAPQVLEWLEESDKRAREEAAINGLSGAEADAFVEANRFNAANTLVAQALLEGSVKELNEVIFPQQAQVAEDHGLALVMYEGGTHVAVGGEFSQNEALIAFYKQFNYSDEMAGIYRDLLAGWKAAGGTLFNAFVDVAKPSQYGSWGALRHLQDSNPRWEALMTFNAETPAWWETRVPSAFSGGRILSGAAADDDLMGTDQADVLAGLGGDDVLRPIAGRDLLLGGDGFDAALLPGAPSDYSFTRKGGGLTVKSATVEAELRDVEMLWFSSDEELAIMVDDLR